jgi:hypothetical protein
MDVNQKVVDLQNQWKQLLGPVDVQGPSRTIVTTVEQKGFQVRNVACYVPDADTSEVVIPMRVLMPNGKRSTEALVVAVCAEGGDAFLKQRTTAIAKLLEKGVTVCLPDLRGTGATKPAGAGPGRNGTNTSHSASVLMLGSTLLGERVGDLRCTLKELRERQGLGKKTILLWGDSFAPVNGPGNLGVPLELKQPPQAEPLGGLVTLLTALYEKDVHGVYARGGLASYQSLLESPFCHVPHDAIVPGALMTGDLPDLVAALAPRAARLDGLVDGLNRRVKEDVLKSAYRSAIQAYQTAGYAERLTLHAEPATDQQVVQWFMEQIEGK